MRDLFKGIKYIFRGTPHPLLPDHLENEKVDHRLIRDVGSVYEQAMSKYEVSNFEQQTFKAAGLIDAARCLANSDNVPILPPILPSSRSLTSIVATGVRAVAEPSSPIALSSFHPSSPRLVQALSRCSRSSPPAPRQTLLTLPTESFSVASDLRSFSISA
uniref:Uncharacterized protein n=1 Tax=Trichogramma kaykai TaxID=54128 RepID=A0ABD2WY95_9HYME